MRFYPNTRRMRIVASALCLCVTAVGLLFVRRHPWFTVLVLINPVIQFANLWTNYWEATETALVQHGMGLRRELRYSDLSYAGPVRGRRLRRWLRASIEVDARPLASPLYVAAADRAALLRLLHERATQAEVVLP